MSLIRRIYTYTFVLAISCLLPMAANAQKPVKVVPEMPDSTAFLKGFAVSADLIGPLMLGISDNGHFEAALRINLKDKYFPVVELGYGKADHSDDVTRITYKTSAPYGRIGLDLNLMKNKHDSYRLYGGVRYAYTNFKYEFSHPGLDDPIWGQHADFQAKDVSCYYHWAEIVFGVDATIWGPVHLGWSGRYKKRLAYGKSEYGNCWYVPGFGKTGSTRLGGTFNIIIDI